MKSGRINEIPLISPLLHLEKKLKMSWKCRVKVCYYDIVDKKKATDGKEVKQLVSFFSCIKALLIKGKKVRTMNKVQPIRDKQLVKDIYQYLLEQNQRDSVIYAVGIYTGLRISDILDLRVRDVRAKENITLHERKTGKEKFIPINRFLKKY